MTATQTQLRRGTSAQCDAMTPAEAEVIIDLTNDRARIGDGTTLGGIPVPNGYDIQQAAMNFAVAAGTANALTLSIYPVPSGYAQPMNVRFRAISTNTGAATIDVNGLGARNILKWSSGSLVALSSGDIRSGGIYEISYDGTQFQLMNAPVASIVSVGQGDLRTSVASGQVVIGGTAVPADVSFVNTTAGNFYATVPSPTSILFNANTLIILPGGQYGFYPQLWGTAVSSSIFLNWTQRFITSSPPYDMGDGDVGGFIFALLNSAGEIESFSASDTPPWAYNGPTDIRCTHKCPITGKKFRRAIKKRTFGQIMDGAKIQYEMQEITNDLKNKDMSLIPHPFGNITPDKHVVLLDPMSDQVSRIIEAQNAGMADDVCKMMNSKYIKIDSDNIKRACPNGVKPCKFRLSK